MIVYESKVWICYINITLCNGEREREKERQRYCNYSVTIIGCHASKKKCISIMLKYLSNIGNKNGQRDHEMPLQIL